MNDQIPEMIRYRFRSSDTKGMIAISDGLVESTACRTFTTWTYSTPLQVIEPHPIRSRSTPSAFWVCLLVSLAGVFGILSDFAFSDEPTMARWGAALLLLGSLALLVFSFTFRREEWLVFPTSIEGHFV